MVIRTDPVMALDRRTAELVARRCPAAVAAEHLQELAIDLGVTHPGHGNLEAGRGRACCC